MENDVEIPPVSEPAMRQRKCLITPQVAREYQQRAIVAREHNRIAKKVAENCVPLAVIDEPRIALVERELARVAKMMSSCEDASDYHKLANARGTLFKEWQVLSGTPNPGARKAGRTAKPAMIQPEPISEAGQPNG